MLQENPAHPFTDTTNDRPPQATPTSRRTLRQARQRADSSELAQQLRTWRREPTAQPTISHRQGLRTSQSLINDLP